MCIVVFGKNGQVGWELQSVLQKYEKVVFLGKDNLDVSDLQAIKNTLSETKPKLIINASAYTNVDQAEAETEQAQKVNALAPAVMSEIAYQLRAIFVHYSTDYVFDGKQNMPYTEGDHANPLNVYGKSKLEGERNIQQVGGSYLILRTSWVYSMRGNTFVNKVLNWARTNKTLKVVNDQISNPTWARDLAMATIQLAQKSYEEIESKSGLYHLSGKGYVSRFGWAKQIIENASNRTDLLVQSIEPVLSKEFLLPAKRPLFSALDCSKLRSIFNVILPEWQESLQRAMQE